MSAVDEAWAALTNDIETYNSRSFSFEGIVARYRPIIEAAIRAEPREPLDVDDPEEDARLDAVARAYFQHRTDVVRSAIDFLDRVQEYARETLRRDGAPGPLETQANVVGAVLRAEFRRDLDAYPAALGEPQP